jgi:hypothetical protein
MSKEQATVKELETLIAVNKLLPAGLRCDDYVAQLEQQLKRRQRAHLTTVPGKSPSEHLK